MASLLRNLTNRALSQSRTSLSYSPNFFLTPKRSPLSSSFRLPAPHALIQQSTMATQSEPKKMEWLVIIPDFPGAHEKRLEVRPQHFAGLGPFKDSGLYQMGGAVLNEVPTSDDPSTFSFAGSTIVMVASSREEIKEVLRKDVYASSGVWDVENAQMWPLLCAFRNQK